MKLPKFKKMPKLRLPGLKPKPKRLQATARRAAPAVLDEYDDAEPTTRFSTALVVVLILHVVAAGGVYAFSRIKATHPLDDTVAQQAPKVSAQKPAVSEDTPAPQITQASLPLPQTPPATSVTPISNSRVYHVKSGDTLTKVANAYSVTASDLAELNGLKETSTLRQGQTLNIPASHTASSSSTKSTPVEATKSEVKKTEESTAKSGAPTASGKTYTVKKGDNPVTIAKTLNVSYEELLKLNKIDDPKKLQIGTVLKLPPSKKAKTEHS